MHSWIPLVLATGLLRAQKAAVLKELEARWFVKGFFTRNFIAWKIRRVPGTTLSCNFFFETTVACERYLRSLVAAMKRPAAAGRPKRAVRKRGLKRPAHGNTNDDYLLLLEERIDGEADKPVLVKRIREWFSTSVEGRSGLECSISLKSGGKRGSDDKHAWRLVCTTCTKCRNSGGWNGWASYAILCQASFANSWHGLDKHGDFDRKYGGLLVRWQLSRRPVWTIRMVKCMQFLFKVWC